MTHFFILLPSIAAFAALALAMERHQEEVFGRPLALRTNRWLRVLGWALLLLALRVAVTAQGWGIGLVSMAGHCSLGAALVLGALVMHGRRNLRR